jgi:hypothetical protein
MNSFPTKQFYTLDESKAFESNPAIKIVYFTEKGIDLLAASPEIECISYAMRNGYSWCNIMDSPPMCMESRQICIVHTTEAELAVHNATHLVQPVPVPQAPPAPINHKANILARIEQRHCSEWTIEYITDIIVEYMYSNNINDFTIGNEVCEIIGPLMPSSEVETESSELETIVMEPIIEEVTASSLSSWIMSSFESAVCSLNTSMHSLQTLTLNIFPIPSNMDWMLLD